MRDLEFRWWLLGAALFAAALEPSPAEACSGIRPCETFLLPIQGGAVPENVDALLIEAGADMLTADSVSLVEIGSGRTIPVTIDEFQPPESIRLFRVVPGEPLVAGMSYSLQTERACGEAEHRFTVTPAAPVPATLGEIMVVDELRGELTVESGGECDRVVNAAQAAIALAHAPDAEPWTDVLHYRTVVDGEVYRPRSNALEVIPPGESWVGRAEDLLFATCSGADGEGRPGLEPGVHRVRFEADVFAGGELVTLSTEEVAVALRCRRIGGGCSVGGATPIGTGLWVLLGGAFLLRRRRT